MAASFLHLIGIQQPIIQAPMAGVSTPALAAAISNEGGLGSIAIGAFDVSAAKQAITELRSLTSAPFNVNVFAHQPAQSQPGIEAAWIETMHPLFEKFDAEPPSELHEI